MHNTSTVFGSNVVAKNNAEGFAFHFYKFVATVFALEYLLGMRLSVVVYECRSYLAGALNRLNPFHKLFVVNAFEVGTHCLSYDTVRQHLVGRLVSRHFAFLHFAFGLEVSRQSGRCHHHCSLVGSVWIVGFYYQIFNLRTHTECRVRWQCPRRCGPRKERWLAPGIGFDASLLAESCPIVFHNGEVHRCSGIFHIAIAAWLVQLVARKSSACAWRIGLNGVTLIEQTLVVELLQEPPKRFDVFVVVSNVRVVEVYKVAHLLGKFTPFGCELHHVCTTSLVVFLCRNVFFRFLVVDVFLRNAQFFLHAEFHRQSVCVPASLAMHLKTLHRLVSVESILNGTCQHVVYSRVSVRRGRTLEEDELRRALALINTLMEDVFVLPLF